MFGAGQYTTGWPLTVIRQSIGHQVDGNMTEHCVQCYSGQHCAWSLLVFNSIQLMERVESQGKLFVELAIRNMRYLKK